MCVCVCERERERERERETTYIFLGEVNEVLQVNVVPVGSDVVVDEELELVLDPVFKDECQNSGR